MKKIVILTGALLSIWALSVSVYAQDGDFCKDGMNGMLMAKGGPRGGMFGPDGGDNPPPPMGGHGMMFGDERVFEKLNLSDEQTDKIEDINEKYLDEHVKIRDKMRPKMKALRAVLEKEPVDIDKARTILREISELQVESRVLMLRQKIEIDSVLTKEQKEKMRREIRSKRRMPMMPEW
ncbi:MAG TPA: Spy/CpxP family protein refolding chaperone [Spirochaetota bacterium]|nr:Spy/CpxP family protein refolding chaperone [Spirochaetota bacterium]